MMEPSSENELLQAPTNTVKIQALLVTLYGHSSEGWSQMQMPGITEKM